MKDAGLSAGDKIDARCSKCGENTRHIIMAISGQTPNRVRCDVCDREHKYRPPTAAKAKTTTTATKRTVRRQKVDPRDDEQKQWRELNPEQQPGKLRSYAMDETYKLTTRIDHPTFGIGVVVGLPGPRKMEVLFKEGKKVLRCA